MKKKATEDLSDLNILAKSIVDKATDTIQETTEALTPEQQAARILGRLGGLKGGRARANKLSAHKRKQIAIHAAHCRWTNQPQQDT